jgi:hypothetical protein
MSYRYLGLGTIVGVDHPEVSNGLSFSLGTSADGYAGLDRFDRVVDQDRASRLGDLRSLTYLTAALIIPVDGVRRESRPARRGRSTRTHGRAFRGTKQIIIFPPWPPMKDSRPF